MTDEAHLEDARRHMSVVALGLRQALGTMPAVGVLIGAAVGLLLEQGSDADVAAYLRALADEIERDGAPVIGNA